MPTPPTTTDSSRKRRTPLAGTASVAFIVMVACAVAALSGLPSIATAAAATTTAPKWVLALEHNTSFIYACRGREISRQTDVWQWDSTSDFQSTYGRLSIETPSVAYTRQQHGVLVAMLRSYVGVMRHLPRYAPYATPFPTDPLATGSTEEAIRLVPTVFLRTMAVSDCTYRNKMCCAMYWVNMLYSPPSVTLAEVHPDMILWNGSHTVNGYYSNFSRAHVAAQLANCNEDQPGKYGSTYGSGGVIRIDMNGEWRVANNHSQLRMSRYNVTTFYRSDGTSAYEPGTRTPMWVPAAYDLRAVLGSNPADHIAAEVRAKTFAVAASPQTALITAAVALAVLTLLVIMIPAVCMCRHRSRIAKSRQLCIRQGIADADGVLYDDWRGMIAKYARNNKQGRGSGRSNQKRNRSGGGGGGSAYIDTNSSFAGSWSPSVMANNPLMHTARKPSPSPLVRSNSNVQSPPNGHYHSGGGGGGGLSRSNSQNSRDSRRRPAKKNANEGRTYENNLRGAFRSNNHSSSLSAGSSRGGGGGNGAGQNSSLRRTGSNGIMNSSHSGNNTRNWNSSRNSNEGGGGSGSGRQLSRRSSSTTTTTTTGPAMQRQPQTQPQQQRSMSAPSTQRVNSGGFPAMPLHNQQQQFYPPQYIPPSSSPSAAATAIPYYHQQQQQPTAPGTPVMMMMMVPSAGGGSGGGMYPSAAVATGHAPQMISRTGSMNSINSASNTMAFNGTAAAAAAATGGGGSAHLGTGMSMMTRSPVPTAGGSNNSFNAFPQQHQQQQQGGSDMRRVSPPILQRNSSFRDAAGKPRSGSTSPTSGGGGGGGSSRSLRRSVSFRDDPSQQEQARPITQQPQQQQQQQLCQQQQQQQPRQMNPQFRHLQQQFEQRGGGGGAANNTDGSNPLRSSPTLMRKTF